MTEPSAPCCDLPRRLSWEMTGPAHLLLSGEFDLHDVYKLEPHLPDLIARADEAGGLTLDMTAVDYCDSAAIGLLLKLQKAIAPLPMTLRVVHQSVPGRGSVHRTLAMTHLSRGFVMDVVEITPD